MKRNTNSHTPISGKLEGKAAGSSVPGYNSHPHGNRIKALSYFFFVGLCGLVIQAAMMTAAALMTLPNSESSSVFMIGNSESSGVTKTNAGGAQ